MRVDQSAGGRLSAAALSLPPSVLTRMLGGPHVVDDQTLQPATRLLLILGGRLGLFGTDPDADVETRRRRTRSGAGMAMPKPLSVSVTDLKVPGGADELPARRYRSWDAGSKRQPTILFLHGGGWVVGDLTTHDALCRLIAVASQCNVVALDYRLAPEHPFPAALDDTVAAFRHLRDNPTVDDEPGRVALLGDSAGGNLAAAACLALRDAGDDLPVAQGLLYPSTDLRMQWPSIDLFASGYFLTRDDMQFYRRHYVTDEQQWTNPLVSPLLAPDHRGLPPAWVWTAGFDPLRDEGAAYAEALEQSGVDVRYRCYTDQIHGFASMGVLPGGIQRTMDLGRQLGALIRNTDAAAA